MILDRRSFMSAVGGSFLASPFLKAKPSRRRGKRAQTLGTARNVVFIFMSGGPSHVDTLDLKTGDWTPDDLGPAVLDGHLHWPQGIMPKLAERRNQFALLRSLQMDELVHERGFFQLVTSWRQSSENLQRTPHLGSLLSAYAPPDPDAILPYGYSFSPFITAGSGYLSDSHRMGVISRDRGYPSLVHAWDDFGSRKDLLNKQPMHALDPRAAFVEAQQSAMEMSGDPRLNILTDFSALPYHPHYITQLFTRQAHQAVKLLKLDMGTRFIELFFDYWDHHSNIYLDQETGIIPVGRSFDEGVSLLLDELSATPGTRGGTLLDETLVVAVGEFGRTTGKPDRNRGRDHYPYASAALFAGGGVAGSRVVGATDPGGAFITDAGWSQDRYIGPADIGATIFSALGYDWLDTIEDPKGNIHQLMSDERGAPHHIAELFAGV